MQDNGPNSCGFDELLECRKELIQTEDALSAKTRDLQYQIGYNVFTLVIGLIAGLLLARMFRKSK